MKNIKNTKKTGFLKKVFIKICRKLGFEIIDQNTFEIVTSGKRINDDLSLIGQNSINLPLGKIKITRQVKALDIIIRTCASVNMLTQSKSRLFEKEKIEYTTRTIRSILNSAYHNPQLKKMVFFCALGFRSALATKALVDMGFKNVANASGGFDALKNAG